MKQQLLDLIGNIQSARADYDSTAEELDKLLEEKEKLEDQIEGRQDDLESDLKNIEQCEEELLAFIRDNEIIDIPDY